MTSNRTHLTEDELDEVLIGVASSDRLAHLADCAACGSQFEQFKSTMVNFNQATAAWSEAKSNALSRDLGQHRTSFRITARAAWSCASVLALAAVGALSLGLHQHSQEIAAPHRDAPWAQVETASTAEMASDDAMLRQIDAAINTAEPSPEELYGEKTKSDTRRTAAGRTQARN